MELPLKVLKAATVGLLVEDGASADVAWAAVESGLNQPYVQKAVRRVASVAMTLQAHGLMKDNIN
jgi:hypothetical protein